MLPSILGREAGVAVAYAWKEIHYSLSCGVGSLWACGPLHGAHFAIHLHFYSSYLEKKLASDVTPTPPASPPSSIPTQQDLYRAALPSSSARVTTDSTLDETGLYMNCVRVGWVYRNFGRGLYPRFFCLNAPCATITA